VSLVDLRFWVQFTKSTKNWAVASVYSNAGNLSFGSSLYTLVATPTAPMSRPWLAVLNYACDYAKGTNDPTNATVALTKGLYSHGHYNGGYRRYTDAITSDYPKRYIADGYENFHIPGFVQANLNGECEDFANFLVCMSNAIGALPLTSQRSATVADITNGSGFTTKPITWSPIQATQSTPQPGSAVSWQYHEWATSTNVFDGCLLFGGTTSPTNMPLSAYHDNLVANTLHNYPPTAPNQDWRPQPGFTPTPRN
jgi:hypothetical protein